MNKIFQKLLGYRKYRSTIHSGKGFLQGTGFDIEVEKIELKMLGITFISDINFSCKEEWMSDLKKRMD